MSITIKELAGMANVSIATISRAMNNHGKVKPETKEIIINLAKKYNYRPNILARNFVKKKTNTIGLILPDVADEFFSDIIRGVDRIAYNGGFNTMIASSHSDRTLIESVFSFMRNGFVDGVILMAPNVSDQIKEVITNADIPAVLINSKQEEINCDTVGIDNYQGAYSMMEYLIKKGYRKIAHIAGPTTNVDAIQRKKAYRNALDDYKLRVKDDWFISGDFTIPGGEHACRRLLSLREKPEVIFAANDMMAIGCYKAIAEFGIKIPDDIAVTGFDDIFVSQFLHPRLTTVHISIAELGKSAANILINRVKNQNGKVYQHIRLTTGLIIGNSCRDVKK